MTPKEPWCVHTCVCHSEYERWGAHLLEYTFVLSLLGLWGAGGGGEEDQAGWIGAATECSAIDWCVRPPSLTSVSQQCITLCGSLAACTLWDKAGIGVAEKGGS